MFVQPDGFRSTALPVSRVVHDMNTGVVMVDFVGDKIGGSLDEQAAELRTVGYRETTARYEPEGPAAD